MSSAPPARVAFSTPWFVLEELPEGHASNPHPGSFYRLRENDSVICITLAVNGDLVMVRQFRSALDIETLETPAGGMDEGETPEEAARRELREETGYDCEGIVPLGPVQLYLHRSNHRIYLVIAYGAYPVAGVQPEAGVDVVLLPRARVRELVVADRFAHTAALAAMMIADIKLGCRFLDDSAEELTARLRRVHNS